MTGAGSINALDSFCHFASAGKRTVSVQFLSQPLPVGANRTYLYQRIGTQAQWRNPLGKAFRPAPWKFIIIGRETFGRSRSADTYGFYDRRQWVSRHGTIHSCGKLFESLAVIIKLRINLIATLRKIYAHRISVFPCPCCTEIHHYSQRQYCSALHYKTWVCVIPAAKLYIFVLIIG